ncbi:MAG: Uma2 family endonuclease [Anaerolineae bacterium]|nr:Uma2 family endonuclease [Anaerolineae bacterium]
MNISELTHTIEDFWQVVEQNPDQRFELIEGVIHAMSPSFTPSKIALRIAARLLTFVDEHQPGHVTGADGGYEMAENTIFVPDVGFIKKEHLPDIPPRHVPMPPDLAVEVFSPTDSAKTTHRKAMKYIAYGTLMVWVVYPEEKIVDVYQRDEKNQAVVQTLELEGSLDGGNVLPGFRLPLKDIF